MSESIQDIPFTVSDVAQTSVAAIDASSTISFGSSNNKMTFAGVVVADKGQPFEVLQINNTNWQQLLGKPIHSRFGVKSEALRHVGDAIKHGDGYVVRVVPDSATYAVLRISNPTKKKQKGDDGLPEYTVTTDGIKYGQNVTLGDQDIVAIYVIDGAQSDNRSISIAADEDGHYQLELNEIDKIGNVINLERFIVSTNVDAMDDMGRSIHIEHVLETQSQYIRATCVADALPEISDQFLTGASNGNVDDITSDNYIKAVNILASSMMPYSCVLGLGCYDADVIKSLIGIANARRISSFFDVDPRLSHAQACDFMDNLAISEPRACFSHFPYTSKDPYFKNQNLWGVSGVMFAAKATGVASRMSPPGWHYVPAGMSRALISRTQCKPIESLDAPDYERMFKSRINKIGTDGQIYYIDDSLTTSRKKDYLRFEQVVSVSDAISREIVSLCKMLKHEPDGMTRTSLEKGCNQILRSYQLSGALVQPRDPDDGTEPYILTIEQTEIDLWHIVPAICVTGSFRRAYIQPILIR